MKNEENGNSKETKLKEKEKNDNPNSNLSAVLLIITLLVLVKILFIPYELKPTDKYDLFTDLLVFLSATLIGIGKLIYDWIYRKIDKYVKEEVENCREDVERLSAQIKKSAEELSLQSRRFTEAQTFKSTGYAHFLFYKNNLPCENNERFAGKTEKENNKSREMLFDTATKHLRSAVSYTNLSLNSAKELNEDENEMLLCTIKNNLAYYISAKWDCLRKRKGDDGFKKYLEQENKKSKYDVEKMKAIDYIKYLTKKEGCQNIPPEFLIEFRDTRKKAEDRFRNIDTLINNKK